MSSFIGDYTCKADNKCRVVVPSSFRKVMAVSQQSLFVLRKNVFEKCIDMYPMDEWEKMMTGLNERLNRFNAKHVAFLREFCRGTQEVEMDANGRILLPALYKFDGCKVSYILLLPQAGNWNVRVGCPKVSY